MNEFEFELEQITAQAESLRNQVNLTPKNKDLALLGFRLREACESISSIDLYKPLVVTLMGGTGVGKSYIFSKLCGIENLSPSSSSVRGFTRQLYIAASEPENRPSLPFSDDKVVYTESLISNIVLIDTPDLDSIHVENASLTHETLKISDIVVYVTTPDKRANFEINQAVHTWANKKRWFFVMNKADTADVSPEDLKKDFAHRLSDMGFKDPASAIFVFSAREDANSGFKQFRDRIFSDRSLAENKFFREEKILNQFWHSAANTGNIQSLYETLEKRSAELSEKLSQAQSEIAGDACLKEAVENYLYSSFTHSLINKHLLFMYPCYALGNLLASPEADLSSLKSQIEAAVLRNETLKDYFIYQQHILEDHDLLNSNLRSEEQLKLQSRNAASEIASEIVNMQSDPISGFWLYFNILLANLLPIAVAGTMLYNVLITWFKGSYMPSDYFVNGIFIFLFSLVPGYLWLNRIIKHRCSLKPKLKALNNHFTQLETKRLELFKLVNDARKFRTSVETTQKEIRQYLPENVYGASAE